MDYVYIALLIFLLLAIFVPLSMITTSRMLRPKQKSNNVKTTNYESAEAPIGEQRDITSAYLPYFSLFLAFELVGIITIIWSFASESLSTTSNTYIITILVGSTILSIATAIMITSNVD